MGRAVASSDKADKSTAVTINTFLMRFGARACLVAQDGARFDFQLQQAELQKFAAKQEN